MGLLDQIVGAALGGNASGSSRGGAAQTGGISAALLQQVVGMLSQPGALNNLSAAFNQQGLGNLVQSWVGKGDNLPISPSQLQQVLGSGRIADIAQRAGISQPEAAMALAGLLPQVVDKVTPKGAVPDSQDELGSLLQSVGKLLN